ncbi:hypothetical protein C4D60_Mb09t25060 [Musa balbisiana]|uniref:Uncharacterized protein n=1 Tax=Musa balbisiana TaxID=52838 RepID=A0A4S8IIX1_MUSBA|nr:hypothetical protein C4D60_Mb09t25060 [Musa balbisiana]
MGSGSDQGLLTRGSPNVLTGFPRLLFFTQAVRLLCRRPTQPPDMGDGTPREYGRMISGEDTLRTMKTNEKIIILQQLTRNHIDLLYLVVEILAAH